MKPEMTDRERLLLRYGELSGRIDATWDLTIFKDGRAVVGIMERPYQDFVQKWEKQIDDLRAKLGLAKGEDPE